MFIIALFKINKTQTIRENVLRKSERVVGSFMVVTLKYDSGVVRLKAISFLYFGFKIHKSCVHL